MWEKPLGADVSPTSVMWARACPGICWFPPMICSWEPIRPMLSQRPVQVGSPRLALAYPHRLGLAYWVEAVNRRANAMRYLLAVCFLAIVAFADASPAAAQQNCACFCRVQGEGGGGCWVDVPGCNPRSGVRACNNGAMCGYNCGTPGLPARRSAPRAHPLGQHYQPTKQ